MKYNPARIAHAALRSAVDRWYADEITYEQMTALTRATWDLVDADAPHVRRELQRLIDADLMQFIGVDTQRP